MALQRGLLPLSLAVRPSLWQGAALVAAAPTPLWPEGAALSGQVAAASQPDTEACPARALRSTFCSTVFGGQGTRLQARRQLRAWAASGVSCNRGSAVSSARCTSCTASEARHLLYC